MSGGAATTMNVPAGFQTGFSFYYASSQFAGIVGLWRARLRRAAGLSKAIRPYSVFVPVGVSFAGTARSVDFVDVWGRVAFDIRTVEGQILNWALDWGYPGALPVSPAPRR